MDPNVALAQQLQALETVPDSYIVVSPELIILTASNAYLADTLTRREQLVGRYLFDAFPDNPDAPEANAVRNWRASLERVIATGKPHQMAQQHYDVPDPERPGSSWSATGSRLIRPCLTPRDACTISFTAV
ncbi:PAS domain-containing protein [Hymenobacter cellulosilyticus]|uniref:PAS domain-containing protein n=1 Tax=Hymenobacter cellulosilyticus TaxID=2932248 RepID=A0A8T9Q7K4_9BACT|nr:PAS domain-containing protein [Hymenobacter cellulosilyticus]UOQ71489.1 PAS domain-containing protein [Hymenobacter cellulosilyticus]